MRRRKHFLRSAAQPQNAPRQAHKPLVLRESHATNHTENEPRRGNHSMSADNHTNTVKIAIGSNIKTTEIIDALRIYAEAARGKEPYADRAEKYERLAGDIGA